ncbi:OmpH family outer membrane protein [Ravibacter arvi]|uniref:OmpH family outer membrane protein n=1 Tax=Ravibacter arvi TaxID=2051041 RepID=A0ABP8M800_9BACT
MLRSLFICFLLLTTGGLASAQKFGYVDMEFIMSKLPEYATAQAEIDKLSDSWAKEIQDKMAAVDAMQRELMAEEVLLTEELKKKRRDQIREKELETREYNNKVFGMNGMLFQKKKELMKDVMDKVQRALDKVAVQRKLDMIIDKSSDFVLVYTNPRHDYTDYVLEELGIDLKPKAANAVKPAVKP